VLFSYYERLPNAKKSIPKKSGSPDPFSGGARLGMDIDPGPEYSTRVGRGMPANKPKHESELISAAEELDAGFRRFEQLSESVQKVPLNSQKNLNRASEMLAEIAAVGEGLQAQLGSVVAAISKFREKQEGQSGRIQKQAELIQERSRVLQGLMEEYRGLGDGARELNGQLQRISAATENGGDSTPLLGRLQEVEPSLERLVQTASTLVERAEGQGFGDIAHQADSLRQQLQAVRNKLNLLRRNVPLA
jgi:chromosome segregation ATPase